MPFARLAVFLLSACLPVVVSAQMYAVKTVAFSGYAAASQSDLLAASGLNPGKAVSAAELQAAALMAMGDLLPARIDNFAWMEPAEIESTLRAKLPLYKGGRSVRAAGWSSR